MHIPDGFIDAGTSAIVGVAAVGGVAVCVKQATKTMDDKQAPLAGLTAAYVFALQMLNFPVAAGTSGHLLGGVLATVLVGPWLGALCITLVLLVQALFFADGGLTALGLNVLNMAFVGGLGGYAIFAGIRKVLPRNKGMVVLSAAAAAALSVVLAAAAFSVEYAIGGQGAAPLATVFAAMIGTHMLIGIGEAVITGLTIAAILAVRPDLIHGARDLAPELIIVDSEPASAER